jgi:hypothetical protein
MRILYKSLVKEKMHTRSRRGWEDNIETDLREIDRQNEDRIHLVKDAVKGYIL